MRLSSGIRYQNVLATIFVSIFAFHAFGSPNLWAPVHRQLPDGSILLESSDRDRNYILQRYDHTGQLDHTFGHDGTTAFGPKFFTPPHLAIQKSGAIVVGGRGHKADRSHFLRLLPSGLLDISFGNQGEISIPYDSGDGIEKTYFNFELLSDDSILFGGSWQKGDDIRGVFVGRLTKDGTLDSSFGSAGYVYDDMPSKIINNLELREGVNGQFILAYDVFPVDDSQERNVVFERRNAKTGVLDEKFATHGRSTVALKDNQSMVVAHLELRPNGSIVAFGTVRSKSSCSAPWGLGFLSLMADGTLDDSFGDHGFARYFNDDYLDAVEMRIGGDGKFFAAANIYKRGSQPGVSCLFVIDGNTTGRFYETGDLDTSYAQLGFVPNIDHLGVLGSISIDTEGSLTMAAKFHAGGHYKTLLRRLLPDGQLDGGFGNEGAVISAAPAASKSKAP